MNEIRDLILERIDIVDYISQYVELKRNGISYKGLCPFHTEKTPSFMVTPSKKLFHCFGCGVAGNVITFVMKYNNLSYIDALKVLAARAGIDFDKKGTVDRTLIHLKQIHREICDFSSETLFSKEGEKCLLYIRDRGFDDTVIREFGLGYIPKGITLDFILRKFSVDIIKKSGLFFYKEGKNIFKFSGRVLFPIRDQFGDIIAFSGRDFCGELPKYINSPETPIFKKGGVLYNLDKAKGFVSNTKTLYVVEGYFDVMRMWSSGYKNVVSSMGTAFTKDQAVLIKHYADNPVVIFDGDQAGINAAYKTIDPFVSINSIPEVVFLPAGEDPDSLLVKNREIFEKCVNDKKDLLLLISEIYAKKGGSMSSKKERYERILKKIEKFPESGLKNMYIDQISKIFNINLELNDHKKIKMKLKSNPKSVKYIYEDDFLAALMYIDDEEIISSVIDEVKKEYFQQSDRGKVFQKIVDIIRNSGRIDALFNDEEVGELVSYLVSERDFSEPYKVAIENRDKLLYNFKSNEIKKLQNELQKVSNDPLKSISILKDIDLLAKELSKYNKVEA
jgi:DNA primase